jgi:hypothetical protein
MESRISNEPSLIKGLVEQIDLLIREAEQTQKPLEVDPFRGRLFELFVMADAAGYSHDPPNEKSGSPNGGELTADALCRALAERWGLANATRESFSNQTRLSKEHLARMRLLWSVMRMWMEWTYAWKRWPEFHREAAGE